jgi:hypothetical protein
VIVYATTQDTGGWSSLSLADTLYRLYDDVCRWEIGAFNQTAAPGNPFDVGWGDYDLITHITTGDSLYIVGLPGGAYKKLWIQRLQGTNYFLRVANLDGSQDTTYAVSKSVASGRNFMYLNLLTHEVLNLEPPTSDWDLVFTPYIAPVQGVPYPVTGVLHNHGVKAARIVLSSQANPDTLTPEAYPLDSCISRIGYDWKRFDMATNRWILADTVYYLVRDKAGNLWRVRFVGFGGSSTGKAIFEKALLSPSASLSSAWGGYTPAVYPHPIREACTLTLPPAAGQVTLLTLTGQAVWQVPFAEGQGILALRRPPTLPSGLYVLRIETSVQQWTQKVVLE